MIVVIFAHTFLIESCIDCSDWDQLYSMRHKHDTSLIIYWSQHRYSHWLQNLVVLVGWQSIWLLILPVPQRCRNWQHRQLHMDWYLRSNSSWLGTPRVSLLVCSWSWRNRKQRRGQQQRHSAHHNLAFVIRGDSVLYNYLPSRIHLWSQWMSVLLGSWRLQKVSFCSWSRLEKWHHHYWKDSFVLVRDE